MNKTHGKQFVSALLLIALLLGFIPGFSLPVQAAPAQVTVTTEAELRDVLENTDYVNIDIDDGGSEFILTQEIKITRAVVLQGKNRKTGDSRQGSDKGTVLLS